MKSDSTFHIDGNQIEGVLVQGNHNGSDPSQKSAEVEYDPMEVSDGCNLDSGAECSRPEENNLTEGDVSDSKADGPTQVSTSVMNPLVGVKEFACFACDYRSSKMEEVVTHILSCHPAPQPKPSLILVQQPSAVQQNSQGMVVADGQPPALNTAAASSFTPVVKFEIGNDPSLDPLQVEPSDVTTESADPLLNCSSEVPVSVSAASPDKGEKNFAGDQCKVCGHVFMSTADAEQHMNAHWEPLGPIGTKRFPCIVCNFRTKEKSCLTRHLLTHFGRKPFACDVCGSRFNRKDSLMKHLRTHTKMKQQAGKTGENKESSMSVGTASSELNSFSSDYESSNAADVESHVPTGPFGTTTVLVDPTNSTVTLDGYEEASASDPLEDIAMIDQKPTARFAPDQSQINPLEMEQSEELSQDSDPASNLVIGANGIKLFSCTLCTYQTVRKSEVTIHTRTHTGETPYACDQCDKKYIARKTLNRHKKQHHGEVLLVCGLCDFRTVQKSEMDQHMSHHGGVGVEAAMLDAQDASNLDSSEVSQEGGPSWSVEVIDDLGTKCFSCDSCDYKSNQKCYLDEHLKTHSGENMFKCNFCEVKYTTKRLADRHMRECHREKLFCCDLCDFKAVKKSDLTEHTKTTVHSIVDGALEPKNQARLDSKTHVKAEAPDHLLTEVDNVKQEYDSEMNDLSSGPSESTQPGNDPFQSEFDDVPSELTNDAFQFELSNEHSQDSGVSRSSDTDVRNKRHTCEVCGYKTSRKYEYTVHMRTHTGEKPYKCSLCDYRTVRKSYVAKHMKTHLKNPTTSVDTACDSPENNNVSETTPWRSLSVEEHFKCEYCDYECDSITEWSQHMFEHTDKTYSCNECDFKTKDKNDMAMHSSAHAQKTSNPIKITCEFCDYLFITKEDMSHHIMTSHPEKCPHSCDVCDFKAFNIKSLEMHKETHTKPYACSICDFRSEEESLLSSHVMSAHANAQEYVCYSCDFKASNVKAVEDHILTTHNLPTADTQLVCLTAETPSTVIEPPVATPAQVQQYLCYACDFKATELAEVEQHILVTHPTPVVQEVAVPLMNLNPETPDFLTSTTSIRGEYFCISCNYKARTIPELEQHIQNCHNVIKSEPTN